MNQQRKNAKRMATKVAAGTLAATLTFGNVASVATPVYAMEDQTTDYSGEIENSGNISPETSGNDGAVVASMSYGEEGFEVVEGVVITVEGEEKVVEFDVIEDAETQIDNELLLDSEETTTASGEMTTAGTNIGTVGTVVEGIEKDYGKLDEMTFATAEEAQNAYNDLQGREVLAQEAYEAAMGALGRANDELIKAEEEYALAEQISAEAAAAAAVKLGQAKEALREAEDNALAANESVGKAQAFLDKVEEKIAEFDYKVDIAYGDAKANLEKTQGELGTAIDKVTADSTAFNEAVGEFKDKYDSFVETATEFYDAVGDAKEAEGKLELLYGEYADAQAALEEVKTTYEKELAASEKFASESGEEYENYIEELEAYVAELGRVLEDAEDLYDDANFAQEYKDDDYAKELETACGNLVNATTDEDKNAAAKTAAGLIIGKELVGEKDSGAEYIVKWSKDENNEEKYGVSQDGFYVVVKKSVVNGEEREEILGRYGYTLDGNAVNIYNVEEKAIVTYGTGTYEATVDIHGNITFSIGEGENTKNYDVVIEGDTYFVEESVASEDKEILVKVSHSSLSNMAYGKFETDDIRIENGKYYFMKSGKRCNLKQDLAHNWYYTEEGSRKAIYVNVTHRDETWIEYENQSYLLNGEGNDKYITIKNGDDEINIPVYKSDEEDKYTIRTNVEYEAKSYEKTDTTNKNSNTYSETLNKYAYELGNYNEIMKEYTEAETNFNKYNDALGELVDAQSEADQYDLGVLANLPKDVNELVTSSGIDSLEDVQVVAGALGTINSEEANIVDKLKAYAALAKYLPTASLGIEDMSLSDIYNFVKNPSETDLGEALFDETSFKYQYLNAWIAALDAKVQVVEKGIKVVETTTELFDKGIAVIETGKALGDSTVDVLLAQIEQTILSGSVETLAVAANVLDASVRIVTVLSGQVDALKSETQNAYDAVVEAQRVLDELELTNPKADELVAAQGNLDTARERYDELTGLLSKAEEKLAVATDYKNEAYKQYGDLKAKEESFVDFEFNFDTEDSTTIEDEETPLTGGFTTIATADAVEGTLKDGKFYDAKGKVIVNAIVNVEGTLYAVGEEGSLVRMGFVIAEDTYTMYFANKDGKIATRTFIVEDGDSYLLISKAKVGKNGVGVEDYVTYYAGKNGNIIVGKKVTIGGFKYTFDEDGVITKKAKVK